MIPKTILINFHVNDFQNLFSHQHSHFCLPLSEFPCHLLFSLLQCLQRYIRGCNARYSKTRFRSWRSLFVCFGMFPSNQATLLHLVSHACRTIPSETTCINMKLRIAEIKSLSRASAQLSNAFPTYKIKQFICINGPSADPISTIIPPRLVQFESWECSLAHLFTHICQCKWPAQATIEQPCLISNPKYISPDYPYKTPLHPYAHLAQGVIFWNIRTFRPIRSLKSEQRQKLISKWAKEKKIVCLLETHLVDNEHLAFEQSLQITCFCTCVPTSKDENSNPTDPTSDPSCPRSSISSMHQTSGNKLNRKAGVAIIIHRSLEPSILHHAILIPGYALLVVFAGLVGAASPWDQPFILIAWYINPSDKLHCIRNLTEAYRLET